MRTSVTRARPALDLDNRRVLMRPILSPKPVEASDSPERGNALDNPGIEVEKDPSVDTLIELVTSGRARVMSVE